MQRQILLLFIIIAGCISCHDGADVICDDVRPALLTYDVVSLKERLQPWLDELPPKNGAINSSEHADNLIAFRDKLKEVCDLNATIVCYACIETLPPQSEIRVVLEHAGLEMIRIIDILTPYDDVMTIHHIHE